MWNRRVTREPLDGQVTRNAESDTSKQAPEDLLELDDLSESDLLQALWRRYEKHQIYTWVGSVLVSINPYRDVGAFSEEAIARYSVAMPPPGPHLFAVVKAALADAPGSRHALLITGESGSGKTEATRAILQFLALRHSSAGNVRDRLLRSTPVLEAFGNAQTRQNSNSSRFGKFIEVQLSAGGEVLGASLTPYMLEASRVSGELVTGERTYHIFYLLRQALACTASGLVPATPFWNKLLKATEWTRLANQAAAAMNASQRLSGTGKNETSVASGDAGAGSGGPIEEFEVLVKSMMGTRLTERQVIQACCTLAAVSILGDDEASSTPATLAASLLGVPEADLTSFIAKTELMIGAGRQERVFRERSGPEAKTLRASLAQEIYAALFTWLTKQVGRSIAAPAQALEQPGVRLIGLLDLYGFEVFSSNGFEQFLINYCNERLQQLFNRQLFQREAEEYIAEHLSGEGQWKHLMEACTLPALALFEGDAATGNSGLFAIINDRSRTNFRTPAIGNGNGVASGVKSPKSPPTTAAATTAAVSAEEIDGYALVETIVAKSAKNPAFCRAGKESRRMFGIRHFAGEVLYEAASFVQKNASANRPDIVRFLSTHGGSFVQELFEGAPELQGSTADAGGGKPRKLFGKTLISSFQQELNELCSTLEARRCRHVRCLRPNDEQKPLFFVDSAVQRQCRYSGLMEATRMRKQGFSHRRALHVFAERYAFVLPGRAARREVMTTSPLRAAEACRRITAEAARAGVDMDDLQVGTTKVFLRERAMHWLDAARRKGASSLVIAALFGEATRRKYLRQRSSAVRIQCATRGMQARVLVRQLLAEARALEEAEAAKAASCKLQAAWRRYQAVGVLQQLQLQRHRQRMQEQQQQQQHREQQRRFQQRSRSVDKQPTLVWPLHRETLWEQAEAASKPFAPPPPILRQASNRGKKDALLGSGASQDTVLIPTPTRSVRATISWEPPSSRSIFSSSCSSIQSIQTNKTKSGSYQPRSLRQEYAGLLSNIRHLLAELPTHGQGHLQAELQYALKRLENATALLTAEEFEAIEQSIRKAEVQVEHRQNFNGTSGPRSSCTCGGRRGPSYAASGSSGGVSGGRAANVASSKGLEGVATAGRVPLAVAAGAVPPRPMPPQQRLPSHHQSYVPISPRTNMGSRCKASTPRISQFHMKGGMRAGAQPAQRCGSAKPLGAQAAAEAAAAATSAAVAAAAARKGLQRVGGPFLPGNSRGTASTTTSSQSSLGQSTIIVPGTASAGASAATSAGGIPPSRPLLTTYAVAPPSLAGLNTWAPSSATAPGAAIVPPTSTAAAHTAQTRLSEVWPSTSSVTMTTKEMPSLPSKRTRTERSSRPGLSASQRSQSAQASLQRGIVLQPSPKPSAEWHTESTAALDLSVGHSKYWAIRSVPSMTSIARASGLPVAMEATDQQTNTHAIPALVVNSSEAFSSGTFAWMPGSGPTVHAQATRTNSSSRQYFAQSPIRTGTPRIYQRTLSPVCAPAPTAIRQALPWNSQQHQQHQQHQHHQQQCCQHFPHQRQQQQQQQQQHLSSGQPMNVDSSRMPEPQPRGSCLAMGLPIAAAPQTKVVPHYMATPRLRTQSPTQLAGTLEGLMTCRATPVRSTAAIGGIRKEVVLQSNAQSPPRRRFDNAGVVVLHSPCQSPVLEARGSPCPQQALPQHRLF